jgi:hypothetical protein
MALAAQVVATVAGLSFLTLASPALAAAAVCFAAVLLIEARS